LVMVVEVPNKAGSSFLFGSGGVWAIKFGDGVVGRGFIERVVLRQHQSQPIYHIDLGGCLGMINLVFSSSLGSGSFPINVVDTSTKILADSQSSWVDTNFLFPRWCETPAAAISARHRLMKRWRGQWTIWRLLFSFLPGFFL
jgi:hypothetical protein